MKRRLYLVDAHAYLHRAYHALPPLTNSKGEPVGALYGFARTLLQLLKKEKPDFVAVCFDHPEPTFRHKAYEAYKATRKELDQDLIRQLARALELAQAMGFTCVELPGYEADDIMATLACKAEDEGIDAVLVTGDKDALQLVRPGIRVLRDVTNSVWFDAPQVEAKYGIPPEQVIDYLSIVGDSTDNVPGVKGIGPVGAVKLLKHYGSLDKALAAAQKGDAFLTPKLAQALKDAVRDAPTWQQLITLECKAPVKLSPEDCRFPSPDPKTLKDEFDKLEFGSLYKDALPQAQGACEGLREQAPEPGAAPAAVGKGVGGRAAADAAVAVLEKAAPAAQLSELPFGELKKELLKAREVTLTASKANGSLVDSSRLHVAVGLPDGRLAVLDESAAKDARADLAKLFSGKALKAGYNLKETLAALELLGFAAPAPIFDTMLAQYCLNPARPKAETFANGDWKTPLLSRAGKALGADELRRRMKEAGVLGLFEELELPLVCVLREMERDGIAVDAPYLRKLSHEFEGDIAHLQKEIDAMAGGPLNVNSPKQLAELLFDKLKLPVVHKTAKGGRSTDEECLQQLAAQHALPGKLLEFRELHKLKSTYIDALLDRVDAAGRVHTRFEQTGAETGRLSSVDPNLQNIPIRSEAGRRIRRAFIAAKGCRLVSADYSQIDLRVLAHVSGDPVLRDSFEKNEDIHTRTASEVFGVPASQVDKEMRRRAKAVNFGIVYGQTPFGLAAVLGIPQREAAGIIHAYFERYAGIQAWIDRNLEQARREGVVRTFLGRLRHLPELSAKNTALRQFGERAARNTPIQGGSADIIKLAMLRVHEALEKGKFKAKMLLQIHDELLFEVPEGELAAFVPWARMTMEDCVKLDVPLVVEVKTGRNWQDVEAVER